MGHFLSFTAQYFNNERRQISSLNIETMELLSRQKQKSFLKVYIEKEKQCYIGMDICRAWGIRAHVPKCQWVP